MTDTYILDGYELVYLPGPGGYSGYHPKRRETQAQTISDNYSLAFGLVSEDTILTLAAPYCSRTEFLSLQARYQVEDGDGLPRRYSFEVSGDCFEVEIIDLNGNPYRGLYQDISLAMRVLSA